MNLIEGIQKEIDRCNDLYECYKELPNGAGEFGAAEIVRKIKFANNAISSGDTVGMIKALEGLRKCE